MIGAVGLGSHHVLVVAIMIGAVLISATLLVRTAATFTRNTVSTACLISILFASGWTSKHSVLSSSRFAWPFSVMSGRRITS